MKCKFQATLIEVQYPDNSFIVFGNRLTTSEVISSVLATVF